MENWKEMHRDFGGYVGEEYKNFWKNYGFNYKNAKEWKENLGQSFKVSDFIFYAWLRDEKKLTPQEIRWQGNTEILRTEYNKFWTDIHEDFGKRYNQRIIAKFQ